MGILNCPKHGESGLMPNASIGICDIIKKNEDTSTGNIVIVNVEYYDNGDFLGDENLFFTSDEFSSLNLKRHYKIATDRDESLFNELIKNKLGTVCVYCFKELMEKIKFPYKFYEHDN